MLETDCFCSVSKSCPTPCGPLWTIARQAPLSTGFSRQAYWSGLPFPSPGGLLDPEIELVSLVAPARAGGLFATEAAETDGRFLMKDVYKNHKSLTWIQQWETEYFSPWNWEQDKDIHSHHFSSILYQRFQPVHQARKRNKDIFMRKEKRKNNCLYSQMTKCYMWKILRSSQKDSPGTNKGDQCGSSIPAQNRKPIVSTYFPWTQEKLKKKQFLSQLHPK